VKTKSILIISAFLFAALAGCDRKDSGPTRYSGGDVKSGSTGPVRDQPNTGAAPASGAGTRSDYKPTTGTGGQTENR
jgi:hypothetical protein